MNILKTTLKWVVTIILLAVIIINFTLIIKSEVNSDEIPDFMGFTPFIIVSGSMEPEIKVNDVIVTQRIDEKDIKVGDVLSYQSKLDGTVITHRVSEITTDENGNVVYKFKGDKNNSEDSELVPYSNIQGKYMISIPLVGTLVNYVKTPIGICLVIGAVILIYMGFEFIDRTFGKEIYLKTEEISKSSGKH